MAKFKAKCKDEHLFVRVRLSRNDIVMENEMELISRIDIRVLLKPQKIRNNLLEYTGPIGVSLYERLKQPVSKYDFFFMIEQVVDSYLKISKNKLLQDRVMWDIHQVYYNEATKQLYFLYVPFLTAQNGETAFSLMKTIGYAAIPQQEPDTSYISDFMLFLNSLSSFDTVKIEKYIEREDKKIVSIMKKYRTKQSGFITDKPQEYYEHYEDKSNDEDDGSKPTGRLTGEEGTALLEELPTGWLTDENVEEDDTVQLKENRMIHYPSLFRVQTGETIPLDKPVFRIGKEKSYVDYFVANNNTVSRSHANIVTRQGRCFVMDLNSKNGTFINDKLIPIEQEIELSDGDYLELANEKFLFNL